MKKIVLPVIAVLVASIVGFNVGAATTVPASGVTYTNGSTSTTVKDSLDDLISKTKVGTATASQILSGKTALVQGSTVTGTMTDRGAVSKTDLAAGSSYTIPAGYHNGSGKVTAKSLSSQTSATATATQILSGQTAYVNGTKLTGTMTNRGAVSKTDLAAGSSYTIPAGYHNGSGKVTAASLADQTSATATASDILSGKTAYVNGTKLTGTHDGGYKFLKFSHKTATVTNPYDFTGSWVNIGYDKSYGCDSAGCYRDNQPAIFSIDLGVTPSSIGEITATLDCNSDWGFRYGRGYSAASDEGKAQYWYPTYITAVKSHNQTLWPSTSDTANGYYTEISISGSTLNFEVHTIRGAESNGTTKGMFQTKCTEFYLSGTVTYK